jgi:hypothetical protein
MEKIPRFSQSPAPGLSAKHQPAYAGAIQLSAFEGRGNSRLPEFVQLKMRRLQAALSLEQKRLCLFGPPERGRGQVGPAVQSQAVGGQLEHLVNHVGDLAFAAHA